MKLRLEWILDGNDEFYEALDEFYDAIEANDEERVKAIVTENFNSSELSELGELESVELGGPPSGWPVIICSTSKDESGMTLLRDYYDGDSDDLEWNILSWSGEPWHQLHIDRFMSGKGSETIEDLQDLFASISDEAKWTNQDELDVAAQFGFSPKEYEALGEKYDAKVKEAKARKTK